MTLWKALPCLLVASGCAGPSHPKLVTRTPDAALMAPCEVPGIPPANPTNQEAAKGWVEAVRIALDCKAKDDALIDFEKAAIPPRS